MALIDDVKTICDRIAPRGWRDLLLAVTGGGLDISQNTTALLRNALTAHLPLIDRTHQGFEDFHATADQAITGGRPGLSLLYHALASPRVHPTASGEPASNRNDYPSLAELDTIENYIYGQVANRTDLADTFVAVLSFQYRVGTRTSHRRHADLAFSRTGVARVGTAKSNYDRSRRSFWVMPRNGDDAVCVLPARYGVFLARRAKPGAAGSVHGGHDGAGDAEFTFPVHKLFAGDECLVGQLIDVEFLEFHRNEKLRKIHTLSRAIGGLPLPAGFDAAKLPYVRDSNNGGKLVIKEAAGASVLIVPKPGVNLVRTVAQRNSVSNTDQVVHFAVPRSPRITTSTLMIAPQGRDRLAPEYVNIRHEVDPLGSANQTPVNLNSLAEPAFQAAMRDGGHLAAHFTDDTCDGVVEAVVTGLDANVENVPAFSLVTAPDFFPLADQSEVDTDQSIMRVAPLSLGRLPANPTIPRPSNPTSAAFDFRDTTVTSIVGARASGPEAPLAGQHNRMISHLPDAASDVFAPGWDTSRSRDVLGSFLTSAGLGSPFPEDAKLCAAIASFWPAVAPDNGRTFGNEPGIDIALGNQLPMLDEELGFHPEHQRVSVGDVQSYRGWDGEFGPFFERVSNKLHVNYVAIERSDYIAHALDGRIRVALTADIQSEDLIARHQALEACEGVLNSSGRTCLVVFRKVNDWPAFDGGSTQLTGSGFLLEFAELGNQRKTTPEVHRVRREVTQRHICQFGSNGIAYKQGSQAFTFHAH